MLLAILACADTDVVPLHFDGPIAGAILASEDGPFEDPVGLVANQRSGVLTPLDVKHGRFLAYDDVASFVRGAPVALGSTRLLSDVVVVGDGAAVHAWTLDAARGLVVQAPWLTGVTESGAPVGVTPALSEPVFDDRDGSGESVTVRDVAARAGRATTERWQFVSDGVTWLAEGTRSGPQVERVVPSAYWASADRSLGLRIEGAGTAGDVLTLDVDTGVVEHPLAARVGALATDGLRVYASVADGTVHVFDGLRGDSLGEVRLPSGADGALAQPGRISIAADGRVFVADGGRAAVWALRFDLEAEPSLVRVDRIDAAAPVVDVAFVEGEDAGGQPFARLFVAPLGLQRVDVYDTAASAWFDPNPTTPGIEGVDLGAPVMGLAASTGPVTLQHPNAWGALPFVPTVSVTTGDGRMFQLEGPTGCGVLTERGAHAPNPSRDSGAEYAGLVDLGPASDVVLVVDEASGEQVVVSACGGVARSETWTVTFRSATQDWEVEGSRSGVQAARARTEERYLSDTGAVSFVLAAGALPPTEGDRFSFNVDAGLLQQRCSDVGGDGACGSNDTPWDLPGRPVAFSTLNGPRGGGWDALDRREYVLLPVTGTDIVARIYLDGGTADVDWK